MADQHNTHRAQYRVRVPQVLACIRRNIAVDTRGGNRMRESCKYGSGAARLADVLAGESPANRDAMGRAARTMAPSLLQRINGAPHATDERFEQIPRNS